MKKFMKEFKDFALKGNVMDMAVGVIIGAAFQSIVTSLTENIINPIIGLLFQVDFSQVVIHMGSVDQLLPARTRSLHHREVDQQAEQFSGKREGSSSCSIASQER